MTLSIAITDREFEKFCETQAGNTAVRVCVEDPAPIYITQSGDSLNIGSEYNATPGTQQTTLSYTVPAGKTLTVKSVSLVTNFEAKARIEADAALIGAMRTSPAQKTAEFVWRADQILSAGQTVSVKVTQRTGSPVDTIETFLSGTLINV